MNNKGKSFIIILIIIIIGLLIGFGIKKHFDNVKKETEKKENIKKGWHVEIKNDYLNVRKEADQFSDLITTVYKGEIYKVTEYVDEDDSPYFWYHIIIDDDTEGFVANPKSLKTNYLIDNNNPNDIYTPKVTFKEDIYVVDSIDDINYDHLTLWDDKDDYTVTHNVYHEYYTCNEDADGIEKYWIKYTITDASGKSSSRTQKIEFKNKPDESRVLDFCKEY